MRFCFLFFIFPFFAFQDADKIPFKDGSSLTWNDFNGKPNISSSYKALTETLFTIEIKTKGDEAIITIQNFFDKDRSWTKDKNNLNLLGHEQTHFNIAEVWARKFRQRLQGRSYTLKIFRKELNAIHSEIQKESKAMQTEYDKETEHSVNEANQKKWDKKINGELQKLSAFSGVEVSCKLSK